MPKFQLVLLIHAHQPAGNFEDVLERAYMQSYLPFVGLLERHSAIRLGLHYSGPLLEWFERSHPEFLVRLRALVGRSQVELVGGGFYEPILISIPMPDRLAQLERMSEHLEKNFGSRPRGAWLTERVWEPALPSTLAPAGVQYTLVDDNQFLSAGLEANQLFGPYLTEDMGSVITLIPGLKSLRYLIPYRDPEEVIAFLRRSAADCPGGFAAMGDDCEKFGVWPKTYEHCYSNGWLERFYSAVEANSDWLETVTPWHAVSSRPALGRVALPNASYVEMMEWALPIAARQRFHSLQQEFASRPDVQPFVQGGIWRNFLCKYPEANLLHKKMLFVSAKVRRMACSRSRSKAFLRAREEATTRVLRAQCNDAYWHGIFGGLYAPHLRTEVWRDLVRAETLADAALHHNSSYREFSRLDFDADGHEELYFTSQRYAALLKPSDGATLAALDFRPAGVTLINSMTRRLEAYHSRVKELRASEERGVASIHEQARAKEEGLDRWLRYDRWPRHSFRLLVFAPARNYADYRDLRLEEHSALAGGEYSILQASPAQAVLESPASAADWRGEKTFSFVSSPGGFEVGCDISLSHQASGPVAVQAGIEVVVNFLAPAVPNRYFESAGQRYPLRWGDSVPASELRVLDEWQKIAVAISAPEARDFWIAPIETVSESEDGFERVYQGSQILAVWPIEIQSSETWKARLILRVAPAS